jgi:two-component system, NtrC family, response regulator HydG
MSPVVKRILIVDDDAEVCALLQRELRGHKVVVAHTYMQALGQLDGIDAVVCDWHLGPDGNGLKLLAIACERVPDAQRILITGDGAKPMVEEGLKLGVVGEYIGKPWRPGAVVRAITRLPRP